MAFESVGIPMKIRPCGSAPRWACFTTGFLESTFSPTPDSCRERADCEETIGRDLIFPLIQNQFSFGVSFIRVSVGINI